MIQAKDYEKLSKFVKVSAKKLLGLFSGHDVEIHGEPEPEACFRALWKSTCSVREGSPYGSVPRLND